MDEKTSRAAAGAVPPRESDWLARVTGTAAYDWAVRVLFLGWYLYVADRVLGETLRYVDTAETVASPALFFSSVAARLAVVAFLATLVACVILRTRPVAKAPGLVPRLTAGAGTFLLMVLPLFPRRDLSLDMNVVATILVLAGNCLAIFVVTHLGRSLSIMAEARRLVTGGPYRLVRHPLYLAEEVAMIGAFIQYASPWTALLMCGHWLLQMARMKNEEEVLRQAFPGDYPAYAAHTARLIPGLY